ncbi:hypothetical protein PybrP1_011796 [[Pythium] brassicae (nom. inval.)]|nr:hypothetical protein PybrP1_011796 [[Pythium] brassicae (nom. inval.)]
MAKPPGRQQMRGAGRKEKQHVRRAYQFEHKLAIINFFRATNDIGAAVNRYFPGLDARTNTAKKKQIYKWERQRATIEERASSVVTTHERRQRATGVGATLPRDAERELSEWISDLRKEGIPASAKMLELRVLEMACELDIPVCAFVASWNWRRGFLRRHRLALRCKTHQGQLTPTVADKIEEDFCAHLQSVVRDKRIVKVLSADQTGVAAIVFSARVGRSWSALEVGVLVVALLVVGALVVGAVVDGGRGRRPSMEPMDSGRCWRPRPRALAACASARHALTAGTRPARTWTARSRGRTRCDGAD